MRTTSGHLAVFYLNFGSVFITIKTTFKILPNTTLPYLISVVLMLFIARLRKLLRRLRRFLTKPKQRRTLKQYAKCLFMQEMAGKI